MVTIIQNKCEELLSWGDNDLMPYSATHEATMLNLVPKVKQLLQSGQSINETDWTKRTPLHWAAAYCSEVLEFLLQYGGTKINAQDLYGDTPLSVAARHGRDATVAILLEQGANPLLANFCHHTPLDAAKENDHPTTAILLQK